MTDSVLQHPTGASAAGSERKTARDRVRGLIWKIAAATFVLMAIGSATRVMNAGLACPDWPLCYGQLVPSQQMNLQVFLEWFHRLDAGLIGLSTAWLVGLCAWERRNLPSWLPWTAVASLLLVATQALLGGLTVTEMLRFDIVTAHLGTALLFFCVLLVAGIALTPFAGTGAIASGLTGLSGAAALLVYGQSLLGGLVGSRWAAHQCLGAGGELCAVLNSHFWGVVPATVATLAVSVWTWRSPALHPWLRWLAHGSALLVALQIALGFGTYRLHLQVEPLTVAHQAIGAALLGVLVAFCTLALRDRAIARKLTEGPAQ